MSNVGYSSRMLSRLSVRNIYEFKDVFLFLNTPHPAFIYGKSSLIRSLSTTKDKCNSSVTRHYRFLTAVSGFPKSQPRLNTPLNIDQILKGQIGEDAYFIASHSERDTQNLKSRSENKKQCVKHILKPSSSSENTAEDLDEKILFNNNHADVIGVADGVGGWRQFGVDPSKFSQQLMQNCEQLITSGHFSSDRPIQLLANAYSEMKQSKKLAYGSSTACLAILSNVDGKISIANMGDSGLMVIRNGKLFNRTPEQVHCFNTPFQLSLPPPGHSDQGTLVDNPEDADAYEFNSQDGDVIILATDGVFDNVPDSLLVEQVSSINGETKDQAKVQQCCNSIAFMARELSRDRDFLSPFAESARSHGYRNEIGGKEDDITVVMAVVSVETESNV